MEEKLLTTYSDVFSDIVNTLLFHGKDVVKENELEEASVVHCDDGKSGICSASKYWKNCNIRIFCISCESEQADDLPFQMLDYDGGSYLNQIGGMGSTNPRIPVISLVLYFGLEHWSGARTLHEALGDHLDEDMKPFVHDYPINLFEIAWLTDEQVAMFQSDFRIVADYFVQMRKNKSYEPSETQIRHAKELLSFMQEMKSDYHLVIKK